MTDESALCLACGLCCAGAFYDRVPLDPDELDHAQKLHLPLAETEPRLTFHLPCPRLSDTACTVYLERPRECANFACGVLAAYRHGEIDAAEAHARVQTARDAFARLRALREAGTDRHDPALAKAKADLSTARRRWFDLTEWD